MTGLDTAFHAAGAAAWGGVAYGALTPHMSPEAQAKAENLCPGARTVRIAAFPYYAGDRPGNLSLYARGEDYHRVLLRRLEPVCAALRLAYPAHRFLPGADNSPLPEREAARLAGVGIAGRHGLLILPPYGSWVFLGSILTTARLPLSKRPAAPRCEDCGRCRAACPTGALNGDGFAAERCLSHLTQKKGMLAPEEDQLLALHPCVWGCDSCQRACPHNAGCRLSPLPEFREDLVCRLEAGDLEGLTNRTFRERWGTRAFAWRGPAVLRRNLALQNPQVYSEDA